MCTWEDKRITNKLFPAEVKQRNTLLSVCLCGMYVCVPVGRGSACVAMSGTEFQEHIKEALYLKLYPWPAFFFFVGDFGVPC